jgi:hypothetical protein
VPLADYDNAVSELLRSRPPLNALQVFGDISQGTLNAVMERHGASLQNLHLAASPTFSDMDFSSRYFIFEEEQIKLICKSCTQLEELTIKIPRSRGDTSEVAIYRALGLMSRLQDLYLMLGSKTFLSSDEQDYDVGDPDYEAKHPSESHAYIDRQIRPMAMPKNTTGIR